VAGRRHDRFSATARCERGGGAECPLS
jgi:hypothetical protein